MQRAEEWGKWENRAGGCKEASFKCERWSFKRFHHNHNTPTRVGIFSSSFIHLPIYSSSATPYVGLEKRDFQASPWPESYRFGMNRVPQMVAANAASHACRTGSTFVLENLELFSSLFIGALLKRRRRVDAERCRFYRQRGTTRLVYGRRLLFRRAVCALHPGGGRRKATLFGTKHRWLHFPLGLFLRPLGCIRWETLSMGRGADLWGR